MDHVCRKIKLQTWQAAQYSAPLLSRRERYRKYINDIGLLLFSVLGIAFATLYGFTGTRKGETFDEVVHYNTRRKDMIQFLVHEKADNVGVATVDIKKGEKAKGLYMDSQEKVEVKALQEIPLGHKIALSGLKKDSSVIKYGHDIGRVVADIRTGEHVHIHNLKTRRW
jgi:(2R)-sulfolactate sulfo-lyase subunit alpha